MKLRINKLLASVIDFTIIMTLTVIFSRLLSSVLPPIRWIYCSLFVVLYYMLFYLFFHATIGQQIMGITIQYKNETKITFEIILKRELIKIIVLMLIPVSFVFFNNHFHIIGPTLCTIILLGYFLLIIIKSSFSKRKIWDKQCDTTLTVDSNIRYHKKRYISLLFLLFVLFIGILYGYNNNNDFYFEKFLGLKVPFRTLEHPNDKSVKPYSDYLNTQTLSAKDYVLSLFQKYDIVILQEAFHDELEEWDLIYDIVSDEYFINNVGTIFTEYGGNCDQADIDSFLCRHYNNTSAMMRDIPKLTYFRNTGYCFFDFFSKIHKLNTKLPDSLKISIRPEEIHYGKYFSTIDFSTDSLYKQRLQLDSLRANVTINWYLKTHHKCLVVINDRHAYIANKKFQEDKSLIYHKLFDGNQAQYVYNCFPGKVANVKYFAGVCYPPFPIQNGKWEAAFKANKYRSVGFNLKNTPFGEDYFDNYNHRAYQQIRYQDVFTGIIFHTPENCCFNRQPVPFIRSAILDLYREDLASGKLSKDQLLTWQTSPNGYDQAPTLTIDDITKDYVDYPENYSTLSKIRLNFIVTWWHFIDIAAALLLWILTSFIIFVKLLKGNLNKI